MQNQFSNKGVAKTACLQNKMPYDMSAIMYDNIGQHQCVNPISYTCLHHFMPKQSSLTVGVNRNLSMS